MGNFNSSDHPRDPSGRWTRKATPADPARLNDLAAQTEPASDDTATWGAVAATAAAVWADRSADRVSIQSDALMWEDFQLPADLAKGIPDVEGSAWVVGSDGWAGAAWLVEMHSTWGPAVFDSENLGRADSLENEHSYCAVLVTDAGPEGLEWGAWEAEFADLNGVTVAWADVPEAVRAASLAAANDQRRAPEEIRSVLEAARPGLAPGRVAALAQNESRIVREAVARRPGLPRAVLVDLANDPDPDVRDAARSNPGFVGAVAAHAGLLAD